MFPVRYELNIYIEEIRSSKHEVEGKVILRHKFSRPVCFGAKHPFGTQDQIFINVRQLRVS
jgi:hypothetical protein